MLYHIAKRSDWETSRAAGEYTVSTINKKLDEIGYIHLSFARQVKMVADFLYGGQEDLVLLHIDPDKLIHEIKVEGIADSSEKFPHLYGALNIDAVVSANSYTEGRDGFPYISD